MLRAIDFPGGKPYNITTTITKNNNNSFGNDDHPTISLQGLQQLQRWQRASPNLQPGDPVLLR